MVALQTRMDPVAQRLAEAGSSQSSTVLRWLDGQNQRRSMRRRAAVCVMSAWGLMIAAAVISSVVAIRMSHDIREAFVGDAISDTSIPWLIVAVPWVLALIAALLVLGGLAGWLGQRLPGFSSTVSAIDWSAASDAVTRLLSAGCTYPEAFRTAAQVTQCGPSRNWLLEAAHRVEQGGPQVRPGGNSHRDAMLLESLIDSAESEPQRQWKIASDHFLDLSRRRLVLMLQSTPMVSTIISGLLIWIAISVTLGWMWRAVAKLLEGLT